ncbi:MAG: hypothetical protein A3J28_05170 [Acidobacteria bacterium RIFCSPLOWO2_12_FULL_60_22]|nr:MAG: hypothetical protein A3J28_05170 [Acidobacteria bacterium RIFCSPLOWO2_12_FULL_60_22]
MGRAGFFIGPQRESGIEAAGSEFLDTLAQLSPQGFGKRGLAGGLLRRAWDNSWNSAWLGRLWSFSIARGGPS